MFQTKPLSTTRVRIVLWFCCACVVSAAVPACACGPFFPSTILDADRIDLLRMPIAQFAKEVALLKPGTVPPFRAVVRDAKEPNPHHTVDMDLADLSAALDELKAPAARRDSIVAAYEKARRPLARYAIELEQSDPKTAPAIPFPNVIEPAGLPLEFAVYFRGAIAFHHNQLPEARAHWEKLLALPEQERKYRSVWAAYMLARTPGDGIPVKETHARYEQVKKLATAGFHDSLGLASESLGWQGRIELDQKHYAESIEFYLEQAATGADNSTSLRDVARVMLADGVDALKPYALDPVIRRLLTAYILARGGPFQEYGKDQEKLALVWLETIETVAAKDVENADRFAWAAYQGNQMETAKRWLARAKTDSPLAAWINAKLAMRAGKRDEAIDFLAKAIKGFPENPQWRHDWWDENDDSEPVDSRCRARRSLAPSNSRVDSTSKHYLNFTTRPTGRTRPMSPNAC